MKEKRYKRYAHFSIFQKYFYEDKKFLSSLSENEVNEIIISEKIIEINKKNNIKDTDKTNNSMIPENSAHVLSVRSTIYSGEIDFELDTILSSKQLDYVHYIRFG